MTALIASLFMFLPATAVADEGLSPNPPTTEQEQAVPQGLNPPIQIFGAVWNLSQKGSYSFNGTSASELYTEYRFKGKSSYMIKMTRVDVPLTLTVYKYNGFGQSTRLNSYRMYGAGASVSFTGWNVNDELYLSFIPDSYSSFAGYIG